jgi:phage portal protein BeeE
MNLLDAWRRPARADAQLSFNEFLQLFNYQGLEYPVLTQTLGGGKQQQILPTLSGLARGAFARNGIVFACVVARMQLFSEVVFKFRPRGSYAQGDLFGTQDLALLEQPWPRGTTRHMLMQMSVDEQLAGNAYLQKTVNADTGAPQLRRINPEWMTIVLGNPRSDGVVGDIDTEVIGYAYRPQGVGDPEPLRVEEVAHFAPIPDPVFPFRGMSWLQPVIEEIRADGASTEHKLKFFENGATPNLVVTLDSNLKRDEFERWIDLFEDGHQGVQNAYRTLYLAGGADAKVVGQDFRQMDFKVTQAHGETRICNAARIPPIIAGVSEGLDSATYSNYGQARRAWADGTIRPLWGLACGTLSQLINVPLNADLWYSDLGVAFLQEDRKDVAEIQQIQAATIKSLIDAGYKPDTVVAAVESGDYSKLVHTGLYSIQLQPPGTTFAPTANGNSVAGVPAGR